MMRSLAQHISKSNHSLSRITFSWTRALPMLIQSFPLISARHQSSAIIHRIAFGPISYCDLGSWCVSFSQENVQLKLENERLRLEATPIVSANAEIIGKESEENSRVIHASLLTEPDEVIRKFELLRSENRYLWTENKFLWLVKDLGKIKPADKEKRLAELKNLSHEERMAKYESRAAECKVKTAEFKKLLEVVAKRVAALQKDSNEKWREFDYLKAQYRRLKSVKDLDLV